MKQHGIFNLVFGSLIVLSFLFPAILLAEIKLTTLPQTSYKIQGGKAIHSVRLGLTTSGVGREYGVGVVINNPNDPSVSQMQYDVDLDEGYEEFFTFSNLKPLTTYNIYLASKQVNGGYLLTDKLGEFISTKDPVATSSSGSTTSTSGGSNTSGGGSTSTGGGLNTTINTNLATEVQCAKTGKSQCPTAPGQCGDGIDNDCDGRADRCGVDYDSDGALDVEPDPACVSMVADEEFKDKVAKGSLIPCTDKCSFRDVFILMNTLLDFVIRNLILPIMVIVIMYTGFKYIRAQGNPVKMSNIKKTFGKIILGIIIILCSWLLVSTFLKAVGYTDRVIFFETKK